MDFQDKFLLFRDQILKKNHSFFFGKKNPATSELLICYVLNQKSYKCHLFLTQNNL